MEMLEKYQILREHASQSYWEQRILAEIGFAIKVAETRKNWYTKEIADGVSQLYCQYEKEGVITDAIAQEVEKELQSLSEDIKKYRVYCTSHAHIDMNWLWGLQETVTIIADTFRTMLQLMEEYPEFKYSQSQAAVYALMEEYYPELIEQIRQRVKEGRWEVTACNWVELDKNMPSGESMTRQILYAKCYLAKLLEMEEDDIEVDFEPDTFGHSRNVPEILEQAGVKYYYHCRGYDGYYVYNWKSPSGASVLVWKEPVWYSSAITYDMLLNVPEFCAEYNIDVMMRVYGVGDHGGGPTRRDLERILDMAKWPLQPTIILGTYREFYKELEKFRDRLPVVDAELNYLLTGCYTSQSRIKRDNHLAEDRLFDSEVLASLMNLGIEDKNDYRESYEKAWRRVLFNQFHDILPGSGKIETREHAMGTYQEALAYGDANANRVLHLLSDQIDTSQIPVEEEKASVSEGAGVGYNVSYAQPDTTFQKRLSHNSESRYRFPQTERGNGKVRIHHIFNTTQYRRKELAEITVWDWKVEKDRITVEDVNGNPLPWQLLDTGVHYWGHEFMKLAILTEVPAMGYTTCILKEKKAEKYTLFTKKEIRVDDITDEDLILENEKIKVVFAADTMKIRSLIDKETGKEMVDTEKKGGTFQYILENDDYGMTAWRVGKTALCEDLNQNYPVNVTEVETDGIRKWIRYELPFKSSRLHVVAQLNAGERVVKFLTHVEWREIGEKGKGIPQLRFVMPAGMDCSRYERDVPMGVVETSGLRQDVPALSFISTVSEQEEKSLILMTDSKYGYRGCDRELQVDLIRASYDPDEYPEIGHHQIEIGVGICGKGTEEKIKESLLFRHPLYTASNRSHKGNAPLTMSAMESEGKCIISAIKRAEDNNKDLIIRCYNPLDHKEAMEFRLPVPVRKAVFTDSLERSLEEVSVTDEQKIKVEIPAKGVRSIRIMVLSQG